MNPLKAIFWRLRPTEPSADIIALQMLTDGEAKFCINCNNMSAASNFRSDNYCSKNYINVEQDITKVVCKNWGKKWIRNL